MCRRSVWSPIAAIAIDSRKVGADADRRGDLMGNRDQAVERGQRQEADQKPGERRPAPLAVAGEAEQRAHFAQRDDDRRHHRDAGQLGDGPELPGVAAALERRRDGLGDFVNRRSGPQAIGARRQMQKALRQRIGEHRQRAEHGDAGDRIGGVLVVAGRRGLCREHRRGAADRRADADQQRQSARDAERAADEDGEGQGRKQRDSDRRQAADAKLGGLARGDLKPKQDDREAQHEAQREGDAVARAGRRADGIVQDDAEKNRQDHRAERRDAGDEPQRESDAGEDRRQGEARRQSGNAAEACGGGDLGVETGHETNSW